MSQKRIPAKTLMAMLLASGLLSADQAAKAQNGSLPVAYKEFYHRSILASAGSATGIAAYDEYAEKDFGVTNLEKGCTAKLDFVLTHIRTRLGVTSLTTATLGANLTTALNAPRLKAMEFDNLMQVANSQAVKWPSALLNSEYEFNIDTRKQFSMALKNFFLNNNRKDVIEASTEDCVSVPSELIYVNKGGAFKPTIYLPSTGISIVDPNDATKTLVFGIETTYIGYEIASK